MAQIVLASVEQETDTRRVNWITHHIGQSRDVLRRAQTHGHVKHFFGEFDYTYPRVAADAIYLWPERSYVAAPYYYDPWGPWGYGPYWGGPFWGPYWGGGVIIVDHHHHGGG